MVIILNKQLLCPLRLFARSFSLLTHDLLVALSMYESDFFIYFLFVCLLGPQRTKYTLVMDHPYLCMGMDLKP